jgi:hypothetical protein
MCSRWPVSASLRGIQAFTVIGKAAVEMSTRPVWTMQSRCAAFVEWQPEASARDFLRERRLKKQRKIEPARGPIFRKVNAAGRANRESVRPDCRLESRQATSPERPSGLERGPEPGRPSHRRRTRRRRSIRHCIRHCSRGNGDDAGRGNHCTTKRSSRRHGSGDDHHGNGHGSDDGRRGSRCNRNRRRRRLGKRGRPKPCSHRPRGRCQPGRKRSPHRAQQCDSSQSSSYLQVPVSGNTKVAVIT